MDWFGRIVLHCIEKLMYANKLVVRYITKQINVFILLVVATYATKYTYNLWDKSQAKDLSSEHRGDS